MEWESDIIINLVAQSSHRGDFILNDETTMVEISARAKDLANRNKSVNTTLISHHVAAIKDVYLTDFNNSILETEQAAGIISINPEKSIFLSR